jgi:hypothetical protein
MTPQGISTALGFAKIRQLTLSDNAGTKYKLDVLWVNATEGGLQTGAIMPLNFNQVDLLPDNIAALRIDGVSDYTDTVISLETLMSPSMRTNQPASEYWMSGVNEGTYTSPGMRADYSVSRDSLGNLILAGPGRGTDTLAGYDRLVFDDRSYDLNIGLLAQTISNSDLAKLIDLYVAYFNRVPEASGLGYWINELASGRTMSSISEQFYAAGIQYSDVTGYSDGMPLSDFIKVIYANVLGRTGDTAPPDSDVDYWLDQVESGAVSREGLVARFLNDARLFYDNPEFGWVPRLLDQKVEFGKLHAVTYGLDYNDSATAIETTVSLAAAVTPSGYAEAVALVGLSADDYLV